jgi:tight adherence protein B
MKFDSHLVFLILVFAAVFTAGQAVIGLVSVATQKRKVNKRLKVADKVDGVSALVMELRKQRGLNADGERGKRLRWLSDLIVASGLPYNPKKWIVYSALAGLVGGMAAAVVTKNPLLFPVGFLVVGIGGPIFYLKHTVKKRAKALGFQLPQALEIIVRSLEAGHPVPTAINLVGREMVDPVGSEFGMAADEIAYGATLETAIGHMGARCRHIDIDLFAATIRLQDRSGGNLTGLLRMNAHTVRERRKLRLKIAAASAEGKMSAYILTAAPFCVLGILELIQPHFYGDVIHEKATQYGLIGLGTWMFLGNLVMRKMINMRI